MYHIEVPSVGQYNLGKGESSAALYQNINIMSYIDVCARCDNLGKSKLSHLLEFKLANLDVMTIRNQFLKNVLTIFADCCHYYGD